MHLQNGINRKSEKVIIILEKEREIFFFNFYLFYHGFYIINI